MRDDPGQQFKISDIVAAWIGTAFAQDDADAARQQWRTVADQLRPRVPKPV